MLKATIVVAAAVGMAMGQNAEVSAPEFGNQGGLQQIPNMQTQRYSRLSNAGDVSTNVVDQQSDMQSPRFAMLKAQASLNEGSDKDENQKGEGDDKTKDSKTESGDEKSDTVKEEETKSAEEKEEPARASSSASNDSPPLNKHKGLEGRIKIAGDIYKVSCDCSRDALEKAAAEISAVHKNAVCKQPSRLHVFADRISNPKSKVMSSSELEKHLPAPAGADIADVKKRTLDYTHKKESKPILGSLGGEIGEFVLATSVYTSMLGIDDVSKFDVQPYLQKWLEYTRSQGRMFSFTYDPDAFASIQDSVAIDSRNVLIFKEGQPATAQVGPELELSKQILNAVTTPNGVGNPYLKRLLKSWQNKQKLAASDGGNAYAVNGDLVKGIIRQIWRLIWNQPTDKYSTDARSAVVPRFIGGIAAGPIEEKAVVLVSASEGCREKNMVPIVNGRGGTGEGSLLVLHPDAISVRHAELCEFFEKMDSSNHVKKDAMCDALKRMFKLHLSLYMSEKDARPVPLPKFSVQYV